MQGTPYGPDSATDVPRTIGGSPSSGQAERPQGVTVWEGTLPEATLRHSPALPAPRWDSVLRGGPPTFLGSLVLGGFSLLFSILRHVGLCSSEM